MTRENSTTPAPPSGTQSVCRALDLLLALGHARDSSVTELAATLKLHVSTVSRLLGALQAYDFIIQDRDTQRVRLGPRCYQLGQVFLSQVEVASVAEPYLHRLTTELSHSTHLAVLRENRLVHLKHVHPPGYVLLLSPEERYALTDIHCEALGKVLLAYQPEDIVKRILDSLMFNRYTANTITTPQELQNQLTQIRERGYATDEGERFEHMWCVAVPIRDHGDRAAAGLSISGTNTQITPQRIPELVKVLHEASDAISQRLGSSMA